MPSWNIHIAEGEDILAGASELARAISDPNVFMFGCLVPDIYVGYMVPEIPRTIPYTLTHFSQPVPIPKPHEEEFWTRYVEPCLKSVPAGALRDVVLGAWAHLHADNVWNSRTNEYLDTIGGEPGEEFRIKKQADFDVFGRTLSLSWNPVASEALLAAAKSFPQYAIDARTAKSALEVARGFVERANGEPRHEAYRLLTDEFFACVFAECRERAEALFAERACV